MTAAQNVNMTAAQKILHVKMTIDASGATTEKKPRDASLAHIIAQLKTHETRHLSVHCM